MRKYIFTIIILTIFISCDESFSPKASFEERYSLNCIIRGDSLFQVATVYKSYNVPNTEPLENTEDPFINGAFIRMWRGNDEIYIFSDSSKERTDTSRYKSDFKYYYIDDFTPNEGDILKIEAFLPNGRRLSSNTLVPTEVFRSESRSDTIVTRTSKGYLSTTWIIENPDQVYLPKLYIEYFENENGVHIRKIKIVPWKKVKIDNVTKYIYPSLSRDYSIDYEIDLITESMEDISKNDSEKKKYTINSIFLELSVYDKNLSTYYFTVGLDDNSFAIGLDEGDYSNIENGFGIFGSFITQEFRISLSKNYVTSFGYNYISQ
jgi:hypothetical protein